jgi:hypothetical protein
VLTDSDRFLSVKKSRKPGKQDEKSGKTITEKPSKPVERYRTQRGKLFTVFLQGYIQYVILAAIIAIGIAVRWVSADFTALLGADPWWFYRHAQIIYDNNFQPPQWDMQSHFPPGRPVNHQLGWPYTLAVFYAMFQSADLSLMKFSGFFVPVFASLSAIPAYFVARMITNRWGALITAFLAVITPHFIGVSVAGYPDSDSVVVFYSFLAVLTTLYAIKKGDKLKLENYRSYKEVIKYLPYIIPALIVYWVFAVNWSFSWYIYFIFLTFIPLLVLFRFIEGKVFHREGGYISLLHQKVRQTKSVVIPIVLIGVFGQILSSFTNGWPYSTVTPDQQLIWGLIFLNAGVAGSIVFISVFVSVGTILGASLGRLKGLITGIAVSTVIAWLLFSGGITGQRLLVFDSIAELTPLDFAAPGGFASITQRVGNLPALFGMIGLIGIFLFKLFTRREIKTVEFFALFWIIVSLSLTLAGERFSLLFGIAVAVAAGFLLGTLIEFFKRRRSLISAFFFIIVVVGLSLHLYDGVNRANTIAEGNRITPQTLQGLTYLKQTADKNALIVAWWDHGHLMAGYTGLRVHSDGAQCSAGECVPYGHDERMVDVAKMFSTNDESTAVSLLKKYASLSDDQCNQVKSSFGNRLPGNACGSTSEIYVIASGDLIPKYYWISYFGSYDYALNTGKHREYLQLFPAGKDPNGDLLYQGAEARARVYKRDQVLAATIDIPQSGIKNAFVGELRFYDEQGTETRRVLPSVDNSAGGLLIVSEVRGRAMFMDSEMKESILTKLLLFHGEDLKHFQLVFENPTVAIYKVNLE